MATSLIPIDEITELKAATDVKSVADDALEIIEQMTVAAAINNAANAGQHSITWSKPLSDAIQSVLEGQGYKLTRNTRAADPNNSWTIGGF